MRPIVLGLTTIIATIAAAPLPAQQPTSEVTGVVRDAEGQPISAAEVFVGRSDKPAITNDAGVFRITDAPAGRVWVAARRIGYAPIRKSVTIAKGEKQVVDLTMEPLPVTLPEIKVVERSGLKYRRLEDFWRRSQTGFGGYFVTREDIDRRNPMMLSQVVRRYLPFAALASWEVRPWDIENDFVFRSSAFRSGQRCAPAISINGGMPIGGWTVDDFPVSEVEAVEVYKPRWSELPIEYSHYPRAQNCGLVILWQR